MERFFQGLSDYIARKVLRITTGYSDEAMKTAVKMDREQETEGIKWVNETARKISNRWEGGGTG